MSALVSLLLFFFFLMIRRPPRSTPFPTRRSSDLARPGRRPGLGVRAFGAAQGRRRLHPRARQRRADAREPDRKSTRLNSSHDQISYAVFCLKKKKKNRHADVE